MKRFIVNLRDEDRIVESDAQINKPAERRLYWFFVPVGSDNSPLPFLPRAHRAGFGPNAAPRIMRMTDSQGVCRHREFRLSVCGKDKFKVMVGLNRDGSDKIDDETYEVWRRIYFSVRYMDASFLFPFGPVHAEYRKHGIWPVEIAPAGGRTVQHIPIIERYEQADRLVQAVTEHHLEARIVLVDRIWISATRRVRGRTNQLTKTITFSDVIWPVGSYIHGNVNGVNIQPFASRSGTRLTLNFSANQGLRQAASQSPLQYDFTIKLRTKVLNGFANSDTGRIVIAARTGISTAFRPVSPRQGTMIHEMGHGLGMVVRDIQEYNQYNGNPIPGRLRRNPTYYHNGGGHCSTAAGGTVPNFQDGTCVMFHYGHNGRTLEFCGTCAPIVKRSNLNRIEMLWP